MVIYCVINLLGAHVFENLRIVQQGLKLFAFVCYFVTMIRTLLIRNYFNSILHVLLLSFLFMLVMYGVFSNHIDNLFPCLNVLLIYYFFYYYTRRGVITDNLFKKFILGCFCVVVFLFVDTLLYKFSYLDSLADSGGMNVGYDILAVMLMAMFYYKNRLFFFLILVSYVMVLFALKRGAVVCASILLVAVLWRYIHAFKGIKRLGVYAAIFVLIAVGISILIDYQDVLFHRFTSAGGSGRDVIYATIHDKYVAQSSIIKLVFGNGFFAAADISYSGGQVIEGFYAHSDFYELIWDHGLFGLLLYCLLLCSILFAFRASSFRYLFVVFMGVWFVQAMISGVYTVLGGQVYFLLLGYLTVKRCQML